MKKQCFVFVTVVSVILLFAGCLSTPKSASPVVFPADSEMYPAVYGALLELHPKMPFLEIDFYNNVYRVGMTGFALTTPLQYELIITKNQESELVFSYANLIEKDSNGRWRSAPAFGFYNINGITSDIAAKMVEIASDQAQYERYEKAAMADITFVYSIMKDFTDLQFADFIANYAKGSVFSIDGKLSDVKESGKEIDGETYKYVVTLTQDIAASDSSYYFASKDYVYCRFYTNQESVIRLSKTASLSVNGILTSASKGSLGTSLFLDIVDTNR